MLPLPIVKKPAAALSLLVCLFVGMLLVPAASASSSKPWTGFGATLSNWKQAHPKNTNHCPAGGCFGMTLKASSQYAQFITVSVSGKGRVDGYSQSWNGDESLSAAKATVLKLMPPDTQTTAMWTNKDSLGSTCVFWNLKSKTLGGWLGDKATGDGSGIVGIALEHFPSGSNPNGLSSDSATKFNLAILDIAADQHGTNC